MRTPLIFSALLLLAGPNMARAADAIPTAPTQVPTSITKSPKDDLITLTVENDMFGSGSDRNYTSGVRLSYMKLNTSLSPTVQKVASAIPYFRINDSTSSYFAIGQNMFTPRDITNPNPNPNDRPWAGFLYGTLGLYTQANNHADEVELTLGMVGPASLARQSQTFIHKNLSHSPLPRGWANQLKNEPIANLGWQRSWPFLAQTNIGHLNLSFAPHIGGALGNANTFANTGFSIQLGPSAEKWQDTPVRVRPSPPGSGIFQIPKDKGLSWSIFAGADGRAIARDIFLDGNTFQNSAHIDKKYFVGDLNAGASLTYNAMRVSYTYVMRSKSFEGQSKPDRFGSISMSYRF